MASENVVAELVPVNVNLQMAQAHVELVCQTQMLAHAFANVIALKYKRVRIGCFSWWLLFLVAFIYSSSATIMYLIEVLAQQSFNKILFNAIAVGLSNGAVVGAY